MRKTSREQNRFSLINIFLGIFIGTVISTFMLVGRIEKYDIHSQLERFVDQSTIEASGLDLRKSATSTGIAAKESMGYFIDESDENWMRRKEIFQLTQPNYDIKLVDQQKSVKNIQGGSKFWADNFEPEFTCPYQERFGGLGDGGKWICDPHRVTTAGKSSKTCLVYSVGSNGNTMFEGAVKSRISQDCEIHTFDLKSRGRKKDFAEVVNAIGGQFHHWGIGYDRGNVKGLKETIKELGHEGKIIDILKIDCELCEYSSYMHWLSDLKETGVMARQLLLEIHNDPLPDVINLMLALRNFGYVMFHKEANYLNQANCIEAAFILLAPEFQNYP